MYNVLKSLSNYINIGLNIKQYFKCIYFTVNHYWLAAIVMESPSKKYAAALGDYYMCKVCSPLAGQLLKILLQNLYTSISSRPPVHFLVLELSILWIEADNFIDCNMGTFFKSNIIAGPEMMQVIGRARAILTEVNSCYLEM